MANLSSRLSVIFAAAVFAALLSVSPVPAQPGPGWGPGMMMGPMMGPGRMWTRGMCDPQHAGFAEWRIRRIEQLVRPTDAQRPKLDELKAASTKAAEVIAAACPREIPQGPVGRLEMMEKRLAAMLEAVKIVRPKFEAFYSSLTKEQQARLDTAGPRQWRWWRWRQSEG